MSFGGLVSSLGCTACCALPIILAGTGLAGAWTLHMQLLLGPYERWLLVAALLLLGLGTITWGREIWRLVSRRGPRASVLTYAATPMLLVLGAVTLAGSLIAEHASLATALLL